MSILAYTGLPGSGKSYECVSEVIAKRVAEGRRIVTNIDGINPEEVLDYCVEKLRAPADKLGSVIYVRDDIVELDDFFPGEDPAVPSFCKRGDIIVIDEAWRFWGVGEKLKPNHLNFFRMHRHYADDVTSDTCDLVFMTQDISDVHRSLKRVVQASLRFKKHRWAGLNHRYVVNLWEGPDQRKDPQRVEQKRYDPSVFPMYQSYKGGLGKEGTVDKREVTFTWKTKAALGVIILGLPASLGGIIWYGMHLGNVKPPAVATASASAPAPGLLPGGVLPPSATVLPAIPTLPAAYNQDWQVTRRNPPPPAPPPPPPPIQLSQEWRLAGFMTLAEGRKVVILADPSGRLRYEDPSQFVFSADRPESGVIDNARISSFSGRLPGGSGPAPSLPAPALPSLPAASPPPPPAPVLNASARGGTL